MLLARVLVTSERPGSTHDCSQISMVLDGESELEIGGQTMRLTRGDALCVPAGVRHTIVRVISTPVEIVDVWPVSGPDVLEQDCCRLGCSRCTSPDRFKGRQSILQRCSISTMKTGSRRGGQNPA